MQSATLFFLASNMGVLFGWQPMSDGSPRYEYVVQLDPELVATLEAGGSIPISSDIPEDIRPIGRIRIVVGNEPLPRTRLATSFKPLEKKSRAGIIETQHRVSPVEPTTSDRYNNTQPQAILPPNTALPSGNPRYAAAPQRDTQSASNPAILPPQDTQGLAGSLQGATQQLADQFRNNGQLRNVGESVRTDAQQMFGNSANNAVSGALGQVGNQVGNTVDRLQQGFQQGVEPFKQAVQQTGQQIRGAVEGIGQRTREVVDQFGRPLREQSILRTNQNNPQSILPPGSTNPQQNFAGSQPSTRGQRLDQPVSSQQDNWQASPWNNSTAISPGTITPGNTSPPAFGNNPPPAQASTTNPGVFDAPWPTLPKDEYRNQASQQNQQPQQTAPQPSWPNNTANDRLDLANHPSGPSFPASNTNQSPKVVRDDRDSHPPHGAAGTNHHADSSAPEIRRNMLDKPADAELVSANGQPAQPRSGPSVSQSSVSQSPERQPKRQPQSADWGWDRDSRSAEGDSPSRNEDPTRALFPLVLSWVLLSGSGAGNLYLCWSFWDVRNKYRGLVHNTRSGGGSRH